MCITAGIGGGKSLYAAKLIFDELEKTERRIVTNCSLDLEEIRYACYHFIKKPVDISKRVRILTVEETLRFFFITPEKELRCVEDLSQRQRDEAGLDSRGILYVLDEFHLVYNAREWQKTAEKVGPQVETYVSQLRKLNDDLVWITQHRDKVDKNFRRNTTLWVSVRNLGKSRLLLGVGLPGKFVADFFPLVEPVGKDKPEYTVYYQRQVRRDGKVLDYGKLYRTMGGIGFGGQAASEAPPKRRHWSIWLVAAVVLVVFAWSLPGLVSNLIGRWVGKGVQGVQSGVMKATGVDKLPIAQTNLPAVRPATVGGAETGTHTPVEYRQPSETNEVFVVGMDMLAGYMRVMLSDGTVERAEMYSPRAGAIVGGKLYKPYKRDQSKESESRNEEGTPNLQTFEPARYEKKIQYRVVEPSSGRVFYPSGGLMGAPSAVRQGAGDN